MLKDQLGVARLGQRRTLLAARDRALAAEARRDGGVGRGQGGGGGGGRPDAPLVVSLDKATVAEVAMALASALASAQQHTAPPPPVVLDAATVRGLSAGLATALLGAQQQQQHGGAAVGGVDHGRDRW